MKHILLLIVIFFDVVVVEASPIKTVTCNSCDESEMYRNAEVSITEEGTEIVAVMDYRNEIARKFRVGRYVRRDEVVVSVTELAFNADEKHDVGIIFQYISTVVDTMKYAATLPPMSSPYSTNALNTNSKVTKGQSASVQATSLYAIASSNSFFSGAIDVHGSPYELYSSSFFANDIYDYYLTRDESVLTRLMSSTLSKIDFPTLREAGVSFTVNFKYVDGSGDIQDNGFVVVSPDFTAKKLEIINGRDRDNNTIPKTIGEAEKQRYRFTEEGGSTSAVRADFELYLGVLISGGGSCRVSSRTVSGGKVVYTYNCYSN